MHAKSHRFAEFQAISQVAVKKQKKKLSDIMSFRSCESESESGSDQEEEKNGGANCLSSL